MRAILRGLSAAEVERIGHEPDYLATALRHPHASSMEFARSWHALHFLLCREAWTGPDPLCHAVLGGVDIGEDLGHGPARVLGPDLVRRVAQALAPLDAAALVGDRYQPAHLEAADIYPGGWEHTDGWPSVLEHDLARLRDFYEQRAGSGDAVLISIG